MAEPVSSSSRLEMEAAQSGEDWELFTHDADIGVRGHGATMAEAFEKAAFAMTAAVTAPSCVMAKATVDIDCTASNPELLFYEWLNAIVFEMATRTMLFSRFKVVIKDNHLTGKIEGEDIDVARHEPAVEVKGATLTELKVFQDETGRWCAQCIVDV